MPQRSRTISEADVLLAHAWDMVYRHDARGVMTYVSPSIKRISGYSPAEWKRHYSTFMTDNPVNDTVHDYTEDTLRTGRKHPPYLVEIRRKDGRPVLLEVSERAYRKAGRIKGIIGVAREVTERETGGAELQRLVGLLSRSNEDLADFASFAAHDLQSPLMRIAMHAEELSREALSASAAGRVREISADAARLRALVRSLLDYTHAGHGEIRPRRLSLKSVLAASLSELREDLRQTRGRVWARGLPRVRGHELSLQRVFTNVIGNALKHRGRQAPLVRVETAREGPKWRITVRDNGVGIPRAKSELVFQPFKRLRRDGPDGSGLGLAICRRIVERHGGRIWAEPNGGGGTAVHFTLAAA